MRLREIVGKEVLDSAGFRIGRIADMEIDLFNNTVKRIFIKSRLFCTFSIESGDIITMGNKIIIRQRKENLKKVQTFHALGIKRRMLYNY